MGLKGFAVRSVVFLCLMGESVGVPREASGAHSVYRQLQEHWQSRLTQTDAPAFGFESLKELVESRDLRSVESVLPHLPEDLRTNYVLMEKSQSLQGATSKDPRAILYSDRGTFVLTFNGDPAQRGFQSLEMMEYHESDHRYEFRRIDFPSTQMPAVFSEANPRRCQGCHQNPMRPNWGRYPFWPGAVGETDSLKAEDEAKLKRFINYGATHPRYQHLRRAENLENIKKQTLKFNPAFALDVLFDIIDSDRLSHWLINSGEYPRYKYALYAALMDCDNFSTFLPHTPFHSGAGQWQTLYQDTTHGLKDIPTPNKRLIDAIEFRIITNLRYALERRGISLRSWAKHLEKEYFMTTVSNVFFGAIGWKLRALDPDLDGVDVDYASYLRHYSRLTFPSLYKPEHQQEMRQACESLRLKSLGAFRDEPDRIRSW